MRNCTSLDHIYPSTTLGTECYCGARRWGSTLQLRKFDALPNATAPIIDAAPAMPAEEDTHGHDAELHPHVG